MSSFLDLFPTPLILVFHKPEESELVDPSSVAMSCASFCSNRILFVLSEYIRQCDMRFANNAFVNSELSKFFSYFLPCLLHLSFIVFFYLWFTSFSFLSVLSNLSLSSIPFLCLYFFWSTWICEGPWLLVCDTVSLGSNFLMFRSKVVLSAVSLRGNSSWSPYPLGIKALRFFKTSVKPNQSHNVTRHKNRKLTYTAIKAFSFSF